MVNLKRKEERDKLTQEQIRSVVDYFPDTGDFIWLKRGPEFFTDSLKKTAQQRANAWNSKWAGKPAFTADNGIGYRSGSVFTIAVKAHQMAFLWMVGYIPAYIDHEDGNRSNNAWPNLKEVTPLQNGRNQKMPFTNTSGHIGVHLCKHNGKYMAYITVFKRINLGYFDTFEEACAARQAAELQFGFHPNHGREVKDDS